MSSPILKISNSVLKAWRTCRRLYHYKFVEEIEPRLNKIQLYRGSVIHKMLDARRRGQDPMVHLKEAQAKLDGLFIEEIEDVEEFKDFYRDVLRIYAGYLRRWADSPLVYTASELQLEYPLIPGKVHFTARLDALAHNPQNDTNWVFETKTHKNFPQEETRVMNPQTILYRWLLRKTRGIKVDGVVWDYIKTRCPSQPEPLKKGGLSKAIRTLGGTDYHHYMAAIKKYGLDPNDYVDQLESLQADEDRFYTRIFLPISPTMTKEVVAETKETAHEIWEAHGKSKARNMGEMNCRGCGMKSLCFAELAGENAKYIRRKEYQPRTKEMSIDFDSAEVEKTMV